MYVKNQLTMSGNYIEQKNKTSYSSGMNEMKICKTMPSFQQYQLGQGCW